MSFYDIKIFHYFQSCKKDKVPIIAYNNTNNFNLKLYKRHNIYVHKRKEPMRTIRANAAQSYTMSTAINHVLDAAGGNILAGLCSI